MTYHSHPYHSFFFARNLYHSKPQIYETKIPNILTSLGVKLPYTNETLKNYIFLFFIFWGLRIRRAALNSRETNYCFNFQFGLRLGSPMKPIVLGDPLSAHQIQQIPHIMLHRIRYN